MNSVMTFLWNQGGRNVSSPTSQRGGKMTKSQLAVPGVSEGDVTYEVAGDVLTISSKGDRRYHAEVLLPGPAETEDIESSYNNGVLELKLKKVKVA